MLENDIFQGGQSLEDILSLLLAILKPSVPNEQI